MQTPVTPATNFVFVYIGIIVIVCICVIYYNVVIRAIPSFENLRALIQTATKSASMYPKHMPNRKSLKEYLLTLPSVPYALSNFYVMTANLGGFFSPVNNAAFSTEAIQYTLQAGVRGIIFDVWPDITKGKNFAPILKVCANDNSLEKLSSYTLDLTEALNTVRMEAFENSANPAYKDPLFLFFRFRGNPTANTLTGTANSISIALEQYRISNIYSNKNSNPLFSTPIDQFLGKVIILSNQSGILNGTRTRFADYVNNPTQPTTPVTGFSTPAQIRALSETNLNTLRTETGKHNILTCAPLPEDTVNSESNAWDWKGAQGAGIQLCGLNLWAMDDGLNAYTDPNMFGVFSFKIKDIPLRYSIEYTEPPIPVKNPGYGNGNVVVP